MKFIHIAGTNGKGSCTEIIANILEIQGYKVGKFMSPHLIKFNEIELSRYSHMQFIIGGSLGLSDNIKKKSHFKLSFSKIAASFIISSLLFPCEDDVLPFLKFFFIFIFYF